MARKTKKNEKGCADSESAQKDTAPQNGTRIEAKPDPQYRFKIHQDICCDVCETVMEIEDEIKLLEQNVNYLFRDYFKKEVPDLIELRNRLEETRNYLSRQNYSLAWGSRWNKLLHGDDHVK